MIVKPETTVVRTAYLKEIRVKAEAHDKQQKSIAEYDEEMAANAKQVEEWKRKAEAYDKGQTTNGIFSENSGKIVCVISTPTKDLAPGYTCRKVKVCEVVADVRKSRTSEKERL